MGVPTTPRKSAGTGLTPEGSPRLEDTHQPPPDSVKKGSLEDLELGEIKNAQTLETYRGPRLKDINRNIVGVASFSAIGGLLFGYDTGVISGVKAFDSYKNYFNHPSSVMDSVIVSAVLIGAIVGSLIAGPLTDKYGRKPILLIAGLVFTLGAGLMGGAVDVAMLIIGRFVAGIGVGSASLLVPMYVSEMSPASVRGTLVSVNEVFICGGMMVAYAVNIGLQNVAHGWRIALGLGGVPSIILFVGMFFLPETPQWLLMKDRDIEARNTLKHVRRTEDDEVIALEMVEIQEAVNLTKVQSAVSWRELLNPAVCKVVIIGMIVTAMQQFVGVNAVLYYAPEIFAKSGTGSITDLQSTLIVGAVNFVGSFISVASVDRLGRRPILIICTSIMIIFMTGVTILVGLNKYDEVPALSGVVISFICIFIFFYAISWGGLAWLIPSEIFPLRLRAKMITCSTFSMWLSNFIVSMVFLPIYNAIGWGAFLIFVILEVVALTFAYFCVPETKGKTLEQITAELGL